MLEVLSIGPHGNGLNAFLHYEMDMSLLRTMCRLLWFVFQLSPQKAYILEYWFTTGGTVSGSLKIFRRWDLARGGRLLS
jgi:hypothetical protein